jgi:hypothetical protein
MSSVVAIKPDVLDDLRDKINACIASAIDLRTEMACHLAAAKAECGVRGITFKAWVIDNTRFKSYPEAVRLARAGESENPAQAIADMRAGGAAREQRRRDRIASRDATDEDEEDGPSIPGQLPDNVRVRGLLQRAKEAFEMAEADDMAGIATTSAMRAAVHKAAYAWTELLSKLEGE